MNISSIRSVSADYFVWNTFAWLSLSVEIRRNEHLFINLYNNDDDIKINLSSYDSSSNCFQ